jgi:hypothetical protein
LQGLSTEDTEKLIDIARVYELKLRFKRLSLINFWLSVRKEYPLLTGMATTTLLLFSTTCLCEKAFSSYTNLKTKHRNRLSAEPDLRLFFFGGTGLPSTMPIKISASFTLKSSFKAPTGCDRFHSYMQLKLQTYV